jgi:hypothetical protein
VRVNPGESDDLISTGPARPFEMRDRAVAGWLRLETDDLRTKRQLEPWVRRGVTYARSLPAKR